MIDKLCEYLTNKIKKQMPEVNDEQAEVIQYGISLIVGEIPKIIFLFVLGAILGLWWQTLLAFWLILPYKYVSGGFHLKTHAGCFIATNVCYCGIAFLSNTIILDEKVKILLLIINLTFGVLMVSKYAPADTINLPILTKKERKLKKIFSYIFLIINIIVAVIVKNEVISNILIFGTFIQTFSITRLAYKITKNEYGYEAYKKEQIQLG